MEEWILILLQSALVSTIISVIISALITWFSSERWVEKNRRKREHSVILKDSSIKFWINKIDEMCPLNTEYELYDNKVYGEDILSYEFLPYGSFIENHIKSGYPQIHKKWVEYQSSVEEYADEKASILDDIRMEFEQLSEKLGFKPYYHKTGTSRPNLYVQPYEIAKAILWEKEHRIKGFDNWHTGKLDTRFVAFEGVTHSELFLYNYSLAIVKISDVDMIKEKILEILDDFNYFHRIGTLVGHEDILITEKKVFIEKLKQIEAFIELGHNIRGRCDACSTHSHKVMSETELLFGNIKNKLRL